MQSDNSFEESTREVWHEPNSPKLPEAIVVLFLITCFVVAAVLSALAYNAGIIK